ncbi:CotS family spore coat protein [Pullulanibacillus sp. KACC 23026]|uniref:CotS family spore coat protein n=1 Tax=Pullulanibacillus sp. KACC 23026 TaxID=3028315 RepID=UPI0023B0B3DE|nr:CotS family spore coat protein [Pullulanibacillus sp. KACC 23026]WEG13568.1 CotS family spore coat protein [Pullulanibacillus sp. KACC 23026]
MYRKIEPWVEEEEQLSTPNDFHIPDYVNEIAHDVLGHYDFQVQSMEVVTTKSDKGGAIWKLQTSDGPKSLKLLHREPARSMFSLGAQEYLVKEKKARVPAIVRTKEGQNYVEAGGKLWFVAEWIESLQPVTKDLEGAKHLCHALGEFHHLTKGYTPPPQADVASRLYKWPKNYEKTLVKMDWFRHLAEAYNDMPASPAILAVIDEFEEQAKRALDRLNQSSYFRLIEKGNEAWGLVHQDYGWSNGQMGAEGMWIIDLDGVSYDIPIRDLRKLISGTMSDLFHWDTEWIREMIRAYHEANPITEEVYELLMIDLSLPNEFYKNIKEMVYEPELFLNEETRQLIQTIVEIDQTKWPVLEEIKNDWKEGLYS